MSHLPEGVTYHIKKNPKKVLHTITKVEEHWFEEVVLTYPDGHKETYFMPQENDKDGYLYDEDCAWYSCNIRLLDGRNIEYV